MNSYGHPVPVVNGNLQRRATAACNSSYKTVGVLWKNFTKTVDSIIYNLKGAYNEPLLNSLTRKMVYSRLYSTFVITDNGIGFDTGTAQNKASLGLLSMKERALSIDAELSIESETGKGTTIKLEIEQPDSALKIS